MVSYVVRLQDKENMELTGTVCENKQDLARFILNLDDERFEIIAVESIENCIWNWNTEFCKKNNKLETGGN